MFIEIEKELMADFGEYCIIFMPNIKTKKAVEENKVWVDVNNVEYLLTETIRWAKQLQFDKDVLEDDVRQLQYEIEELESKLDTLLEKRTENDM